MILDYLAGNRSYSNRQNRACCISPSQIRLWNICLSYPANGSSQGDISSRCVRSRFRWTILRHSSDVCSHENIREVSKD